MLSAQIGTPWMAPDYPDRSVCRTVPPNTPPLSYRRIDGLVWRGRYKATNIAIQYFLFHNQRPFQQRMLSVSRLFTLRAKPTVTFFHNSNSKLSNHILSRLTRHDTRYLLDIRKNKLPLYRTYHFIHEQCMNVHPQNARSFERIFPALLASPSHLFCDVAVKKELKQKQFVPDLDLLSEDHYLDLVAAHSAKELTPFVVDWNNQLVAIDDEGLDRIMHNYYSCGMQKSSMIHDNAGHDVIDTAAPGGSAPSMESLPSSFKGSGVSRRTQAAAMMYAVHPHVAEFADLF